MQRIILITTCILFTGCVTQQRCENKFGECGKVINTHTIEYRDTLLYIKGKTITDTLSFWQHDTIHVTDSTGKLTADIVRIKDTEKIYIRVNSKPDTIQITKWKEIIKEGKVKTVEKWYVPFWMYMILGACILITLKSQLKLF